jgi:hypothetical protein
LYDDEIILSSIHNMFYRSGRSTPPELHDEHVQVIIALSAHRSRSILYDPTTALVLPLLLTQSAETRPDPGSEKPIGGDEEEDGDRSGRMYDRTAE